MGVHMAKTEITTCDGCGKEPPKERFKHYTRSPGHEWAGLLLGTGLSRSVGFGDSGTVDGLDLCSLACLLKVARRLNGLPEVDELEAMFVAPAARRHAGSGKVECQECGARGYAGKHWSRLHAEHLEVPCGRIVTSRGRQAHQRQCATCSDVMAEATTRGAA